VLAGHREYVLLTRNGLQPASATHMHSTSTVMMDRACLALIDIID
jgi:hypothetical protein